jgi:hypothetical protein
VIFCRSFESSAGQEMPSASDAYKVRKVDCSLASNVMRAGYAFETKIKKRLGHGSFFEPGQPLFDMTSVLTNCVKRTANVVFDFQMSM